MQKFPEIMVSESSSLKPEQWIRFNFHRWKRKIMHKLCCDTYVLISIMAKLFISFKISDNASLVLIWQSEWAPKVETAKRNQVKLPCYCYCAKLMKQPSTEILLLQIDGNQFSRSKSSKAPLKFVRKKVF